MEEHLETLCEARTRLYLLDDAAVKRIVRVHRKTLEESAAIYECQLEH